MSQSNSPSGPLPPSPQAPGDSATILGQPVGLFLLFMVEMWERFSYYGMRGLLVLYLTAVLAPKQLPQGTYHNTLKITEIAHVDGQDKALGELSRPMTIAVGQSAPAANTGQDWNTTGSPPLVLQRLVEAPDPAHPGQTTWAPAPADSPLNFQGARDEAFSNGEARFIVHNPTDQVIKVTVAVVPDTPGGKTYATANDTPGETTTDVRPDSKRAPDEKPFVINVNLNNHDSGRNWTSKLAYNCLGWYAGLCYLVPILGGLIADRLIGTHRSMIVGGLLIALGHIALAVSGLGNLGQEALGMDIFIGGMALIVVGTGHFKPSVSVMVGQLYGPDDPRRDGAFSIFYMGINLGAFICNLVCGTLAFTVGWHWGFGAAAVGMLLGLGMYLAFREKYLAGIGLPPDGRGKSAPLFILTGFAIAILVAIGFHFGALTRFDQFVSEPAVWGTLIVLSLAWAVYFTVVQKHGDRGPVATIFIFTLFNAFFWLAYEQAGTTINLFTDEKTDRHLAGYNIPTPWFQSINPFLILVGAPLFAIFWTSLARRRRNPSQPIKIAYGLFFLGLGYLFMTWAGMQASSEGAKAAWILIAATYFWHTVGELCLSPTGLAYVTKAAPAKSVSLLMGVFLLSSFIANLGGAKIAGFVDGIEKGQIHLWWSNYFPGQASYFFLFVFSSALAALAILILTPWLKTLMRNPND